MPAMSERELGQLAGGNPIAGVTTDICDCTKTGMQRVSHTAALGTKGTFATKWNADLKELLDVDAYSHLLRCNF